MKQQAFNPYLPSWEYIPDGEPHVFGDRLYLYGSHDRFNGHGFCLEDYVCYSAPVDDLSDWKYEGILLKRTDDPRNPTGHMAMFAPDVCRGADGRYYLYYVLSDLNIISVAVCEEPAGRFRFYGNVRHADGSIYGERAGDDPQFDPAVYYENGKTYLYTGFCPPNTTRLGSTVVVLGEDMLTVLQEPKTVAPSCFASEGTGFEGHEFFEASSLRKVGECYCFVYSSIRYHELCYAISDHPTGPFRYMGTVVSACDIGIGDGKPAGRPMGWIGNNHGGMECVNGQWYIFYHRHTNRHAFSRQGCAEPIKILPDGTVRQVRVSSCGLNGKPLVGKGAYPAYIACHFCRMQDGKVIEDWPYLTAENGCCEQYITNIRDGAVIGFRSFDCQKVARISVKTAAMLLDGVIEIALAYDGEAVGRIRVRESNDWAEFTGEVHIPDGVHDLYFRYKGSGNGAFAGFTME